MGYYHIDTYECSTYLETPCIFLCMYTSGNIPTVCLKVDDFRRVKGREGKGGGGEGFLNSRSACYFNYCPVSITFPVFALSFSIVLLSQAKPFRTKHIRNISTLYKFTVSGNKCII